MGRPKGSWQKEANPRYRGGRYKDASGYVFVRVEGHPNADKRGYVREHVFVMANSIGRPIARDEVVHHRNEIKDDNRIDNLELMKRGDHHSFHHKGIIKPNSIKNLRRMTSEQQKAIWSSGVRDADRAPPKICDFCGKEFKKERLKGTGRSTHKHQFCDRNCFQGFMRTR